MLPVDQRKQFLSSSRDVGKVKPLALAHLAHERYTDESPELGLALVGG
jgi:hypothetical protein